MGQQEQQQQQQQALSEEEEGEGHEEQNLIHLVGCEVLPSSGSELELSLEALLRSHQKLHTMIPPGEKKSLLLSPCPPCSSP